MLEESLIASVLRRGTFQPNSTNNGAEVSKIQVRPISKQQPSFKKSSSTNRNCLAVSSTHIFAAQADKAAIHICKLDGGTEEVVRFTERISSCKFIGGKGGLGALAIGTEKGRLILWELCTGRQVSTPPSHLEAISCIASDPTANFLLTGSNDSNINVWSMPEILSFTSNRDDQSDLSPFRPRLTFSDHQAAITGLVTGCSQSIHNIAASTSEDKTCLIWDYHTGDRLCIFLLPYAACCLAIDPVQRNLYAGYDDGSIQRISLLGSESQTLNPLYAKKHESVPIQPDQKTRWRLNADIPSAALALGVSYDGTLIFSGHEDGKVRSWNVSKGHSSTVIGDLNSPVTNILMLPLTGFWTEDATSTMALQVIKPNDKLASDIKHTPNLDLTSPEKYCFTALPSSSLSLPRFTKPDNKDTLTEDFNGMLEHDSFPGSVLNSRRGVMSGNFHRPLTSHTTLQDIEDSNIEADDVAFEKQLAASRKLNDHAMTHIVRLTNEIKRHRGMELARTKAKRLKRAKRAKAEETMRRKAMGEKIDEHVDMMKVDGDEEDIEGITSSTDEFAGSD